MWQLGSLVIVFVGVVILFTIFCLAMGAFGGGQGSYAPEKKQKPKYESDEDPFPREPDDWRKSYEDLGNGEYGKPVMGGLLIRVIKTDDFGRRTGEESAVHAKTGKPM